MKYSSVVFQISENRDEMILSKVVKVCFQYKSGFCEMSSFFLFFCKKWMICIEIERRQSSDCLYPLSLRIGIPGHLKMVTAP
jgi:hypothetical protein